MLTTVLALITILFTKTKLESYLFIGHIQIVHSFFTSYFVFY